MENCRIITRIDIFFVKFSEINITIISLIAAERRDPEGAWKDEQMKWIEKLHFNINRFLKYNLPFFHEFGSGSVRAPFSASTVVLAFGSCPHTKVPPYCNHQKVYWNAKKTRSIYSLHAHSCRPLEDLSILSAYIALHKGTSG